MADVVAMPSAGPWTVDDLRGLPDDGLRYELVDGLLVVSPPPTTVHQLAVSRLLVLLDAACPTGLVVLTAPVEVRLSERSGVQPDVLVCAEAEVGGAWLAGTPMLVVEVRSPSTALYDALTKRSLYEGAGVPSYWLVDPERPSLRVLELEGDRYADRGEVVGEDGLEVARPFAVVVRPADLVHRAVRRPGA
jgi:Uma2 family endonuclease